MREDAERAARLSETFISILGHDLRSPLSAIKNNAQLALRGALSERQARSTTRILSSVERMTRMVSQLLDLARLRVEGGIPIKPTSIDLAELVNRVVDEIEAAHPDCSISLALEGNTVGGWDSDRLEQVVVNLVTNAVQHGDHRRVALQVDGHDEETIEIRVHNSGAIPDLVLPSLFEPLMTRVTGSDGHGGSGLGLGLYISRRLAEAHGGSIDVTSTVADGTVFRVQLPRWAKVA